MEGWNDCIYFIKIIKKINLKKIKTPIKNTPFNYIINLSNLIVINVKTHKELLLIREFSIQRNVESNLSKFITYDRE